MPLRLPMAPLTAYPRNLMLEDKVLILEIPMACKAKQISDKRLRFNMFCSRRLFTLLLDAGPLAPVFK